MISQRRLSSVTQSGFTLLEIVIALAIVAIAVLAIATAMGGHTRATSGLEQRMVASWVASNTLTQIRHDAKTERVKTGRRSDSIDMGGFRWRTVSRIEETEVERVFLVTVTVENEADPDRKQLAQLTSAVSDSF